MEKQNTKIEVMDERKADKKYVDDKINGCATIHNKKTSVAPSAKLSAKQKQLIINAIVGAITAASAYIIAHFGG